MQIIVVGCGKVGATLAEQLSNETHDITIVDTNAEKVQKLANAYDVMGVVGNGASYSTLMEAGIEVADLLIAVTGSDEQNLLCCLFAKKTGNCQTIARVRNPIYNNDIRYIKDELGLSMTINPEYTAATEIARLLRFPSAIKIDTFSRGKVELIKFKIKPEYKLHGFKIMDVRSKLKCDILVCAVERGDEVVIPDGNFTLAEEDLVSIVGTPVNSTTFFEKIGIPTNRIKDAIIVGGGKITYYLAEQLKDMRISLSIIESDKSRCEELSESFPKAIVIHGDGTDKNILLEEGLKSAEAFIALTNMDEENILLSLYAKSQTDAKLVAKINRITFDDVINKLDVGSIIYPKYITANYILRYVRGMQNSIGDNIETLYKIIDNKAEAIEFKVSGDSSLVNRTLDEMSLKSNLLIASIYRNGKVIIPSGQDFFLPEDLVVVITTNPGLKDLKDILKK